MPSEFLSNLKPIGAEVRRLRGAVYIPASGHQQVKRAATWPCHGRPKRFSWSSPRRPVEQRGGHRLF